MDRLRVKYEEIYLREHGTMPELSAGLETWFQRYNNWRPHESLGNLTPAAVHRPGDRSGGTCRGTAIAAA